MLAFLFTDVTAADQSLAVKASTASSTVKLLSRPHGNIVCTLPDATPIRYIKMAKHGPHKFAAVVVLDGKCANQEGYIAWNTLNPETPEE